MVASELSGVPWSLTVHRWDIREDNLLSPKTESAAFVRAISADGLADLRRTVGRTSTPTLLIHMGVPLPPRPVEPASGRRHEPMRVLVPANLLEVKGHRYLVDAVAQLRSRGIDVRVTLAGQGPMRGAIESQITALGVEDSFTLVGQLSHAELLGRLGGGASDVVAMPSIETRSGEKEGIPVSLLEAMSYGVAVLGTDIGGMAELLGDGSGLITPPADPGALAGALERLASEPELRTQIGARGRARIERDFSSESVVGELLARFEAAASGRIGLNGSVSSAAGSSVSGVPKQPRERCRRRRQE
jgi:glycosyltransferase involved in cell wall biosynthesis